MKVLVIGCGSIGKRHIRNLVSIGQKDILAFDIDSQRLKETREIASSIKISDNLRSLLNEKPQTAFIAVPTSLHIEYAIKAAEAGCHLFIEKPLSHNTALLDRLAGIVERKRLVVFVGYNFRFNRCIAKINELLKKKAIGEVVAGRTHFGSYLPERHPEEDYRAGYGARKSLGGGVILDTLSHHLDYIVYLLGKPKEVFSYSNKASGLEIDVEDTAEVLLKLGAGKVISLHADSVQRPYKHTLELIGERGTITCNFFKPEVKYYDAAKRSWITFKGGDDLNDMYLKELRHFIRCVRRISSPPVDLSEGRYELELLMKIKQSAREKRWIKV